MKLHLVIACILFSFVSHAQWYPHPFPLHKKDFAKVAANKYTMAFEFETKDGDLTLTRVVEFGAHGLPAGLYTKGTNDNGDSINKAETIYKFDGAGRLLREIVEDKEEGGSYSILYTYSKDGKLTKKQIITIDPPTTTYTYQNGKLVKAYTTIRLPEVDDNGELNGKAFNRPQQKESYVYDKGGRLKEILIYNLMSEDGAKKWSRKIRFTYDDNNQLIKRENLNEEEKVYNTETYEYNANALIKKSTVQTDNEELKTFVYEYCTTCKQSWMK